MSVALLDSEKYGYIKVAAVLADDTLIPTIRTLFYDTGATEPGSVKDYQVDAALLMAGENLATEDLTLLQTPTSEEDINMEEYQAAKERFIVRTKFIVGDLQTGGIFMAKYQNLIHFGVVYAYLQYSGYTEPRYAYQMQFSTYSQTGFTVNQCREVMICFTGNEYTSFATNFPSLRIIAKGPNDQLYSWTLDASIIEQLHYGEAVAENTLYSATNDPMYYAAALGTPKPNKIWSETIEQILNGFEPPSGALVLWGRWDGNSEVDPTLDPDYGGGLSEPSKDPGDFSSRSDKVGVDDPNASGIDACNSGFVTLYNPTHEQIQQFNNFLFSDSITEAISTALKKLIADPIDYLVFIAMVRCKPPVSSPNLEEIKFCGIGSGVSARVVDQQALMFKYKPFYIDRRANFNGFEDYNPFSQASIYLPYIGWRDLNIDEIMDSTIQVYYKVDCMTGSCVAEIHVSRSARDYLGGYGPDADLDAPLYTFSGNCFEMMPLNATDFRGLFGSIMQTALGVGSSVMSGNVLGAATSLIGGAASAKVNVEHSGNISASPGYYSSQRVLLKLERPIQSLPQNYDARQGRPSNVFVSKLSKLQGYCEIEPESLILDGMVDATKDEIEEIRTLLSEGMIF